jgi:multiple sugar transport system permease protein
MEPAYVMAEISMIGSIRRVLSDIQNPVRRWGYVFVLPGILYFAVFIAYPIVWGFCLSFTSARGIGSVGKFVGLANYLSFLTNSQLFWLSLRNTFYYAIIAVPGVVFLALLFGILFEFNVFAKGALRVIYFIPAITSIVAIGVIWSWLYEPTFGVFNHILTSFHLPRMGFLNDKRQVIPAIAIMGIWQWIGYNMIIVQAGLAGIPNEYYETASLDGATKWQCTWRVTLPLLMPIIRYLLVTSMITNLQVFDQIYIMTQGGPGDSSSTIAFLLYQTAFTYQWFGSGSALAFILFIIILVFTILAMRLIREPQ